MGWLKLPTLLERIRRIHSLLEGTGGSPVSFDEMASVLGEVLEAPVFVASRRGKILGGLGDGRGAEEGSVLSDAFNTHLLRIEATLTIPPGPTGVPAIDGQAVSRTVTAVPVKGSGARLGTLLMLNETPLGEEELVLVETGAAVVAMEILRSRADASDAKTRDKERASLALSSLSYSEFEAVRAIFEQMEGREGLLVTSRIADREGITRSVIVNALRKLESAGVIEARSLGMKGTHIRVRNDSLLGEVDRMSD